MLNGNQSLWLSGVDIKSTLLNSQFLSDKNASYKYYYPSHKPEMGSFEEFSLASRYKFQQTTHEAPLQLLALVLEVSTGEEKLLEPKCSESGVSGKLLNQISPRIF